MTLETPALDDPVAELRAKQLQLAAQLDELSGTPEGTAEFNALFSDVNSAVVAALNLEVGLPEKRAQVVVEHYAPRTRVLSLLLSGLSGLLGLGAVCGWVNGWLLVLVVPLLVCGIAMAINPGGPADSREPGTVEDRLLSAVFGLVAVALTAAAGLLSGWFLIGAIPATFGTAGVLFITTAGQTATVSGRTAA
jgi:hypothetical protein